MAPDLVTYYAGSDVKHAPFFHAPAGLGIHEALAQRDGKWYRTREGARRGLLAKDAKAKRERSEGR